MTTEKAANDSLDDALRKYRTNWVLPLTGAYAIAYEGIKGTIKKQEDFDAACVEVFISIATIGLFSGIGTAFAKRATSAVAKSQSQSAIKAITQARDITPVELFFSKSKSKIESYLQSETIETLNSLSRSTSAWNSAVKNPTTFSSMLAEFVERAHDAAKVAVTQIAKASDLTDDEKAEKFAEIIKSDFCSSKPMTRIFPTNEVGATQIELRFYMDQVTRLDHFDEYKVNNSTGDIMPSTYGQQNLDHPIKVRTTDPSYPKPYRKVETTYVLGFIPYSQKGTAGRYVYAQLGGVIWDRIEELYRVYTGKKKAVFMKGGMGKDEIKRAEDLYDDLTCTLKIAA